MKVEQAKQIASNAIEQLRQALEAGQSERLKDHLAAMARFRRYSLLCCAQHKKLYVIRRTMLSESRGARRGAGFRAPELT